MPEAPPAAPLLVASDLDGTLLRTDGTLSARTHTAIERAEDAGITVVFVTARPPRRLDELADAVGPHGVAICGNGAFVYDVAARAVIEAHCFSDQVLYDIVDDLRAAIPGIAFGVECADGMGHEPGFVRRSEIPDLSAVDRIDELAVSPVGKLLGRDDGTDPVEFHDRVEGVLAGRAELGYSGAVGLAEITATGVTKAAGLARWCAEHGIDSRDVWAFGDMPNDLPMLRWAGVGFAVGGGHPDVLAAADRVCAANDDDGVAQILESVRATNRR